VADVQTAVAQEHAPCGLVKSADVSLFIVAFIFRAMIVTTKKLANFITSELLCTEQLFRIRISDE
jgi:hypothetical protein